MFCPSLIHSREQSLAVFPISSMQTNFTRYKPARDAKVTLPPIVPSSLNIYPASVHAVLRNVFDLFTRVEIPYLRRNQRKCLSFQVFRKKDSTKDKTQTNKDYNLQSFFFSPRACEDMIMRCINVQCISTDVRSRNFSL